MSVPSQQYVALYQLQQLIIENSLGIAAAGATVSFFEDSNRSIPKDVFELAGNYSSGYTFNNIGSTVTLGAAGTFIDESGNDFVVYCYPYDSEGNLQLYYVTIVGADSTIILTREAVPANVQYQAASMIGSSALTQNAISNPQFVQVNFTPPSSFTFSVTGTNTVSSFIPDWDIITTGAGTVTLSQVAAPIPTTSTPPYTNPPYVLGVNSTGVSAIALRQRLAMSPTIFYGQNACLTFLANSLSGDTYTNSIIYSPSSGQSHTLIYNIPASGGFEAQGGPFAVNGTENSDPAPAGYVDIILNITPGANIQVTSFQLVTVATDETTASYLEEPAARQIDHLYHYAYPIVPIGTVIDYAGFTAPLHYLLCDGTNTYDRIIYQQLLNAITLVSSVTLNSSTTYTDANAPKLHIGTYLEGTGIPANTTISSISGTTITISNAATITGASSIMYFPWGAGDTTSHFAVPNLLGQVTAGVGGGLFGAASSGLDGVGYAGGSSTSTALLAHTHGPGVGVDFISTIASSATNIPTSGSGTAFTVGPSTASAGSGTSFSLIQPTTLTYKYIRYQ